MQSAVISCFGRNDGACAGRAMARLRRQCAYIRDMTSHTKWSTARPARVNCIMAASALNSEAYFNCSFAFAWQSASRNHLQGDARLLTSIPLSQSLPRSHTRQQRYIRHAAVSSALASVQLPCSSQIFATGSIAVAPILQAVHSCAHARLLIIYVMPRIGGVPWRC